MTEWRLFDGDSPHVSTFAFHEHRERAAHLEQEWHRARLLRTAELVRGLEPVSVVDLGCGDGGLLSLLEGIDAWGYDFQPSNQWAWEERGVRAEPADAFAPDARVEWGQVAVMTEVLEHLADPHGTLARIAEHVDYVVASSPWNETGDAHCAEHAWAWDEDGYLDLFEAHFDVQHHERVGWSQLIVARSKAAA